MQSIVYGFDFGTSNSAISVLDNDKVSVLPIGTDRELLVRSVMFFPEKTQTCFIGCDAIREYIASGMRGRFISSFKSMLPVSSFAGTTIHGKWFSLEQLIGSFLSTMKTKADSLLGEDVRSVVIGRPAVFSKNQSEEQLAVARLTEAAQIAGFEKIHFQLEPVAAALSYEATLEKEELVFVVDLGGGTSDFTVMQLSPEKRYSTDRKCDILTTGGVSIGGDTFSSQIMQHKLIKHFGANITYQNMGNKNLPMPRYIMTTICDWKKIPYLKEYKIQRDLKEILLSTDDKQTVQRLQELIDQNLGFSVFESIESTKIGLSERETETIEYHHSIIDISEPISRTAYETMIEQKIATICENVDQTLEQAGIEASSINTVFLTGGTSKTPIILQEFSKRFRASRIQINDVFTSVVTGLARSISLFKW